jgi:beta-ureidopropionase
MPRIVRSGLIQMSLPKTEGEGTIEEIKEAMVQKHIPLIEEAGKKGVQILCFQEIFNTPYFCPGQDKAWYESAETVPGPTIERMQEYAKKYNMVIIVPVYEKEQAGVLYNTAAVIDADGTYLGKYRKNHIPHTSGFWENFSLSPVILVILCFKQNMQKWVCTSVTTATSRWRKMPGIEWCRDRLQSICNCCGT